MSVSSCFRCGDKSYEQFRTHGYCTGCNYSADLEEDESDLSTLAWACRVVDEAGINQQIEKKDPPTIPMIERASLRFAAAVAERKVVGNRAC
jgi:hypothetical protein